MKDILIRSLQGRATPREAAQLRSWREASPENERDFRRTAELWNLTGEASPIQEVPPAPALHTLLSLAENADADIPRTGRPARSAMTVGRRASDGNPARARASWGARLAAVALAAGIAFAGFGLGAILERTNAGTSRLAYSEVQTGAGERAQVTLTDGTAVVLGPSSSLRVITEGESPVVRLEGRAYFGVIPDSTTTFTVETRYGIASALGTRFEVRTEEEELRVVVVEGSVRVSAEGAAIEIGAGMMSRSSDTVPPSSQRVEDVDALLDWIGSTFVFRTTPLRRVAMEIERRFGVPVSIEDEALEGLTVTATFTDQSVDHVVFVVCEIVAAACTREDGGFHLGIGSGARPPDPPAGIR